MSLRELAGLAKVARPQDFSGLPDRRRRVPVAPASPSPADTSGGGGHTTRKRASARLQSLQEQEEEEAAEEEEEEEEEEKEEEEDTGGSSSEEQLDGPGIPSDESDDWDDRCATCGGFGELVCCDSCVAAHHLHCVGLAAMPGAGEEWKCPLCTAMDTLGEGAVVGGDGSGDEEDVWDSTCGICERGGDLLCCDGCPKAYHLRCLDVDPSCLEPDAVWLCPDCEGNECSACGTKEPPLARDNRVNCGADGCGRTFHLACIGLDRPPSGNWYCRFCVLANPGIYAENARKKKPAQEKSRNAAVAAADEDADADGDNGNGVNGNDGARGRARSDRAEDLKDEGISRRGGGSGSGGKSGGRSGGGDGSGGGCGGSGSDCGGAKEDPTTRSSG